MGECWRVCTSVAATAFSTHQLTRGCAIITSHARRRDAAEGQLRWWRFARLALDVMPKLLRDVFRTKWQQRYSSEWVDGEANPGCGRLLVEGGLLPGQSYDVPVRGTFGLVEGKTYITTSNDEEYESTARDKAEDTIREGDHIKVGTRRADGSIADDGDEFVVAKSTKMKKYYNFVSNEALEKLNKALGKLNVTKDYTDKTKEDMQVEYTCWYSTLTYRRCHRHGNRRHHRRRHRHNHQHCL